MVKYPICMDHEEFCQKCQAWTMQSMRIYPDTEYHSCKVCGTHRVLRFDREVAQVLIPADRDTLETIERDLQKIANDISTRKWGVMVGKKDAAFINGVRDHILGIIRQIKHVQDFDSHQG